MNQRIMLHETPLRNLHEEYARRLAERDPLVPAAERPGAATGRRSAPPQVEYVPWGPADESGRQCEIVGTWGEVEAEYAAIRRGAAIVDSPHRGTLIITGSDRRDFLNRLLTADLSRLEAGGVRRSFWLNRKGRIIADLTLIELGDRLVVDLDIHQTPSAFETLNEYLFAEDVVVSDASAEFHRIAVHGNEAMNLIAAAAGGSWTAATDGPGFPDGGVRVVIGGVDVIVARQDQTGEAGLHLIVPRDQAAAVWQRLLEGQSDEAAARGDSERRSQSPSPRPAGWYALNIARIEAGQPIFNIDFGPENLPHETGVLHDRVSFTKGCFVGQEVVARTEHLGRPKQMLVGLRIEGDLLPVAGGQVFDKAGEGAMMDEPIGVVTSSTLSPMLGAQPIAFAMVRSKRAEPGTAVRVSAEGEQVEARVQGLGFLPEHTGAATAASPGNREA